MIFKSPGPEKAPPSLASKTSVLSVLLNTKRTSINTMETVIAKATCEAENVTIFDESNHPTQRSWNTQLLATISFE